MVLKYCNITNTSRPNVPKRSSKELVLNEEKEQIQHRKERKKIYAELAKIYSKIESYIVPHLLSVIVHL